MTGNNHPENNKRSYVTNSELKATLNGIRWEVRALILASVVAGRFIPAGVAGGLHAVKATIGLLP